MNTAGICPLLRWECHSALKGGKRRGAKEEGDSPEVAPLLLCSEALCPACIAAVNEMRKWMVHRMAAAITGAAEPRADRLVFLDYPKFSQNPKIC